eukprot:13572104-Alexandrium_andersonii.AAC.1
MLVRSSQCSLASFCRASLSPSDSAGLTPARDPWPCPPPGPLRSDQEARRSGRARERFRRKRA